MNIAAWLQLLDFSASGVSVGDFVRDFEVTATIEYAVEAEATIEYAVEATADIDYLEPVTV